MNKFLLSLLFSIVLFSVFTSTALATIDFTISNPVIVGDEIEIDVSLTGLTSSSCSDTGCYLQGALRLDDGSYFGSTLNTVGSWVDYISSVDASFIKTNFFNFVPTSGSWTGKVKVKNMPLDSNYKGPGTYQLKLKRYSGNSSSSAGDSNILMVALTASTPAPAPTSTPTSAPTATSIATSTPRPTTTPTVKPIATKTPTPKPTPTVDLEASPTASPEVLGDSSLNLASATASAQPVVNGSKAVNFPWIAALLITLGVVCIGIPIVTFFRKKQLYNNSTGEQSNL